MSWWVTLSFLISWKLLWAFEWGHNIIPALFLWHFWPAVVKQVVHLQSRAGAGSPRCSHISSRLHRGSTLKLKMGLRLFFSSVFVSHVCLFLLPTSTAGEPLEEVGVDFGALARTSASAISYGITQQGFAILGQSHLLFLITFYCIILKIFVIFQLGPFLACLDLWHTPSWFQTEGSNCRSQLQFWC